jgi:hypothetical protein
MSEVTKGELVTFPQLPQSISVDVYVQPSRRGIDKGRNMLHQVIIQCSDTEGEDTIPQIHCSPLQNRIP